MSPDEPAVPSQSSATSASRGKSIRWMLWLPLVSFLMLIVLVAALPTLVTHTPLGRALLSKPLARQGIRLQIGRASLGWFRPARLHDLQLTAGLLRELERPFGLVLNRAGLGDERIEAYCKSAGIPLLMKLPNDPALGRLGSEGRLFVEEQPEYQKPLQALALELERLTGEATRAHQR